MGINYRQDSLVATTKLAELCFAEGADVDIGLKKEL